MPRMEHAVILAGGSGTRLWPLSRRQRPKQLMRIFGGASLIQLARRRLADLFPPDRTWVVTSADHLDLVAAELPDLPRENLIGEPIGRDTANAIGLAVELLRRRDPAAVMAVFTADHLIEPQAEFAAAVRSGLATARQHASSLITFGIVPDHANPGYGYLRRGPAVAPGVYRVAEFKEKPPLATAEAYVRSGEYLWNSGMFVWSLDAIGRAFEQHLPDNSRRLRELAASWHDPAAGSARDSAFAALPKVSIDFGVMEKAADVLLVEMRCRWMDLGSWTAIAATQPPDAAGNVALAARVISLDGERNIIVGEGEHLIATLGVSDLVIVHSPDATLICRRADVERIRELTAARTARFGDAYE